MPTDTECRMRCEHCLNCIEINGMLECDLTGTLITDVEECPDNE